MEQCIEGVDISLKDSRDAGFEAFSTSGLIMSSKIIRVVSLASDGAPRPRDFENFDEIEKAHEQVGIDDCSTDLTLRGLPVFRGLIGPIPESRTVVRYETPDVFEMLTKEWAAKKRKRRRRRTAEEIARDNAALAAAEAEGNRPDAEHQSSVHQRQRRTRRSRPTNRIRHQITRLRFSPELFPLGQPFGASGQQPMNGLYSASAGNKCHLGHTTHRKPHTENQ